MKKTNVGIILIDEKIPFEIGDEVLLKREINNKYDENIIKCIKGKQVIGYVSSDDYTVPEDCLINKNIIPYFKLIDEIQGTVVLTENIIYRKIDDKATNVYIVEVYLPDIENREKEKNKKAEVIIGGTKKEYPYREKIIEMINSDQKSIEGILSLKKEEIIVNENAIGNIKNILYRSNSIIDFTHILNDDISIIIELKEQYKLIGKVKLNKQTENQINKEYLNKIAKDVVRKGLDGKENMHEKLEYIKENNIPDFLFAKILETYIKYSNKDNQFLKKPQFTYIDKQGIMKRALHYLTLNNKNLTFVGERGAGKSTLAETIAWIFNRPAITISFSRDTDKYDIWGYKTIDITKEGEKKVIFIDGPLTKAIRQGYIVIFDEINVADPGVLESMNSVLDHRREVYIPELGQIKAHKNFMAITTENNDTYQGVNKLNEAFRDRFIRIKCLPYESIKDLLIIKNSKLTLEIAEILDSIYKGIRKLIKEGEISEKSLTIRGFENAALSYEPEIVSLKEVLIDCVLNQGDNEDDKKHIMNIINMEVL